MSTHTLEVHARSFAPASEDALLADLEDAIDLASDQDGITWLTDHGKRIAAIVPIDVAEHHLASLGLRTD